MSAVAKFPLLKIAKQVPAHGGQLVELHSKSDRH